MSVDPVIRDIAGTLQHTNAASCPEIHGLLLRALSRSRELERSSSCESASFFRQLGSELLRLRGSANAKSRLECLFQVSSFLWQYGEARGAIPFASHAIHLAKTTNHVHELRRAYLVLGALYADSADPGSALQLYIRSLEVASKSDDRRGECLVWNNLAALFNDCGMFEEGFACATHCLRLAERCQSPISDLRQRAQNNIALARYHLGDYSGAIEVARSLAALAAEPQLAYEVTSRITLEGNLIFALLERGDLTEAKTHIDYAKSLVTRFPAPRQQLFVSTFCGLFDVMAGDEEKGIQVLENAVSIAQSHHRTVFRDALSALARAYDEVGDCERALEVTRRLIAHLESIHLDASIAGLTSIHSPSTGIVHGPHRTRAELRRSEAELQSKVLQRELARSRQEMLERMAVAADIREDISGEHGYRVGRLSALLAREIGWDRDACNALDIAARLHDIGKIGIPEKILLDEKTLRQAEKHFIASHTLVGAEILAKSDIPQVRIAEEIARCHHEWWDGSGYPRQLKETVIPKSARMVALADVFDAMTHGRPYAKALPVEEALNLIASLRGRQFDPELTDHFLALVRRLLAENDDLDAYLGKAARNSPFLKARARIKELLAQGRDSTALSEYPRAPGSPLN